MRHFINRIRQYFIDKYNRDILWLAFVVLVLLVLQAIMEVSMK